MPRKKAVAQAVEPEEKKEEIKETPYSELHEIDLADVISGELDKPVEEEKPEEKKEEAPPVEPKKEEPPKDEGVDFDPKAFAEETAKKAADLVEQKLGEKLTKEEKKEEVKTFREEINEMKNAFEIKNGKAPDWDELMEIYHQAQEGKIQQRVEVIISERENKLNAEKEQRAKADEEVKRKTNEAKEAYQKRLNEGWDEEISELTSAGKLPPVINKDDKSDLGVKARAKLWATMAEVNQKRVDGWVENFTKTNGHEPTQEEYNANPPRLITSIGTVFALYYKPEKAQPAGSDAPVSAGVRPAGNAPKTWNYDEIHNKELSEIMRDG